MKITVILCTLNRADSLRRTLHSAADLRIPPGLQWEFLLIDNGSSDHTAQVVTEFESIIPIRRIVEPMKGLSHARNCGVSNASGEYICWTDDDVLLDPSWLEAYLTAFSKHPHASVFGGVIEPVFDTELPDWWLNNKAWLSNIFAERDFGPVEVALSGEDGHLPYGANFAVRRTDQLRVAYDPELGVGPTLRRVGEETAVILALLDNGAIGFWVPESRVKHLIPARRLSLSYARDYYRSLGETWASLSGRKVRNIIAESIPPGGVRVAGMPMWLLRRAAASWIVYAAKRISASSAAWMKPWTDFQYCMGALRYCRK